MLASAERGVKVLLSCAVVVLLLVGLSFNVSSGELETVEIKRSWTAWTGYVSEVLGKEKGFYEDVGLELKMVPGKGSTESIRAVAMDRQSFGIASAVNVLGGKAKGMPLKVVGCLMPVNPMGIIFREGVGIETPEDLEGKTVAAYNKSTRKAHFLAFLEKNDVDIDKVEMKSVGAEADKHLFAAGKVDATLGFLYRAKPRLERQEGIDIDYLRFHDYGVRSYAHCLITNEKTIKERPELVRKMVQATMRSWEYATKHPEEAIDAFIEKYPELNRESELAQFRNSIPFTRDQVTEEYGFGYMSRDGWEATQAIALVADQIEKKVDINEVYTNKFLK